MAEFAFSANYVPGKPDESAFINDIVLPLTGDINSNRKPALRRFFFECYTNAAADINRRASRSEDDEKPKKIPVTEREDRFQKLKERLTGLTLRNELEPSTMLIDKFVEMEEVGELRYVKWEEYTRRNQESKGVKKEELWKEDGEGRIKRLFKDHEEHIVVGGDLLAARYALQRRGLALNVARLMSFEVHELLVEFFFEEMARESLPGFHKVSLEQVRRADREIFVRLAEQTRGGFTKEVLIRDELPLDNILRRVMLEPRIQALLFPLQAGSAKQVSTPGQSSGDKRLASENEKLRADIKKLKSSPAKGNGYKGQKGGKGKGKGKGNKGSWARSMPVPLIGMAPSIAGERPCYDYNMTQGCKTRGVDRCASGVHKCMFPGCGQDHSLVNCPAKKG
jgi:hypothetical protein